MDAMWIHPRVNHTRGEGEGGKFTANTTCGISGCRDRIYQLMEQACRDAVAFRLGLLKIKKIKQYKIVFYHCQTRISLLECRFVSYPLIPCVT